jgi:purine-cytosine permease-like protein
MPDDHHSAFAKPATDSFGRIEARGIDQVPDAERHGQAGELFAVWAASNTTYLYILLGGALVGMGLNAWQGIAVVVAGNLFWLLVGLLSISGPAAGSPSSIVMRAMFGVLGNRLNVAITGCAVSIAYEAINLCIAALAGFALLGWLGISPGLAIKLCMVIGIAAVTLTISVYGHATIVRLSVYFAGALAASVAVLAAYLAPHINLHFVPPAGLHGAGLIAAALGGVTIIASGPLSWGTAADYARYLPAATSSARIFLWTALGGFLPSLLLGALGVLAGTAVDMADPQESFATILPNWFYPIFLLVIITGATTNNVLTAYSSGLSLQSLGIEASRSVTVLFDGIAGVGLALYALFVADFIDTLNNILALSVSLLGPSLAIYGMDILLRGNRYNGADLHDGTKQGAFWYSHGFNWVGLSAFAAGAIAALLCANTKLLVGPVARWLDGADLSALTGPAVAAGVYGGATWYGKLRRMRPLPPGEACDPENLMACLPVLPS